MSVKAVFLSKEERAKLALKRREAEVAARREILEKEKVSQQRYQEEASGYLDRKHWDGREEEREKQREETLLLKDKEREIYAIKVCILLQVL